MAFQPDTNTSNNAANYNRDGFEKAQAFLNFYLPTQSGGRIKVGAIPLRASDKSQKAVLDYLATNDESAREILLLNILNKMQMEYTSAETKAVELAL